MRSFAVPAPLPPIPTVDLPAPPQRPRILTDEREQLCAEYEHHVAFSREKAGAGAEDEALARWRAALSAEPAVPINAAELFSLVSRETLRDVWQATPPERWDLGTHPQWCRWLVAVLGEDVLDGLRSLAAKGRLTSGALLDVAAPWVAPVMGFYLLAAGREWLVRHEDVAYAGLVHAALTGDERYPARALRWMARRDGGAGARRVARETWGSEIEATVVDMLRPERAAPLPFARPLPKMFAKLPRVRLRSGEEVDAASMEAIGRMLATPLPPDHPAMQDVIAACDPASLAALARAMFDEWVDGGMATQNRWIAHAHVLLGGDDAARELGRLARKWARAKPPHERRCARLAAELLGVVASDVALAELGALASAAAAEAAREAARDELERVALERGEDVEELVPSSLPVDVGMVVELDYGARTFRAMLDPTLSLVLTDAEGSRIEELPRPTKKDDASKVKAAKEALKELRQTVKDVFTTETARLENAMIAERRWSPTRFRERILGPSVSAALASRLVWGAWKDGVLVETFRVAEDRTLATVDDAAFDLDGAEAGIVHSLHLDEDRRARWRNVLRDYQIIQPFEQIERTTYPRDRALPDGTIHPGSILGLTARGWRIVRTSRVEGLEKRVPHDAAVAISITPGFAPLGFESDPQTFGSLRVVRGEPSAVAMSEIYRDLTSVIRPAS